MIFLNDKIAAGEVKCTHIALASSNRPSVTVWPGGYYQMKPLVPGHIRSSGLNIVHSNGVTILMGMGNSDQHVTIEMKPEKNAATRKKEQEYL